MARVTLVVNDARESSETFLHTLGDLLVAEGHQVVVHQQSPGRATMPGADVVGGEGAATTTALPPVTDRRFAMAAARLAAAHPSLGRDVARRAAQRFGRGPRAVRAAALALPILSSTPDVVHVSFSGIAVALADAWEMLDGAAKLIISCRGSGELVAPILDPALRRPLGEVLARADGVHVVADCIAEVVRELAPDGVAPTLIRPAIDLAGFEPRQPRRSAAEPVRIVTVSRLHWIKAIDVQLLALAELRSHGVPATLDVVGDGPERGPLEFRARSLGLGPSVRFLGAADRARVRTCLSCADVFVLSSLSEGTSNAVLEAMAAGVPVVSSSVGGMSEVLTDGHDALLVAPSDPSALAGALRRLVAEPQLATRLADNASATVSSGFGLDRQRHELAAFYRAVLSA
jgi:glycosyltransferase involved in cell wall biosynthesis